MAEFDLEKAVGDILAEYSADVSKAAETAITAVTKEATKKLKQSAPRRTGKYAKGWASKVDKGVMTVEAVVYGKTRWREKCRRNSPHRARRRMGR